MARPILQIGTELILIRLWIFYTVGNLRDTPEIRPSLKASQLINNRNPLLIMRIYNAVFLLRHANLMQSEEAKGAAEEQEKNISHIHMAILKSWLPLLCRASNGTDTPTLNSREKAKTVRVLEELIAKLSWEQQEEVLALWLHHFAAFPDSDWPNLESYYAQWYSDSRKLLIS